jgi:hypothetical protein
MAKVRATYEVTLDVKNPEDKQALIIAFVNAFNANDVDFEIMRELEVKDVRV